MAPSARGEPQDQARRTGLVVERVAAVAAGKPVRLTERWALVMRKGPTKCVGKTEHLRVATGEPDYL
jgi:hypothetical protein